MFNTSLAQTTAGVWLCAMSVAVSAASAQVIKVLPADTVRIQAQVGDDAAFVGTVTLDSVESVADIALRSSDLVGPQGERIRAALVTLVGASKFSLAGKAAHDADIKVAGIKIPGVYTGTLYFLRPAQTAADALAVPIEVTATAVPKLAVRKGSESLKVQFINCWGPGCRLAAWLRPASSLAALDVALDNSSLDQFEATVSMSATGEVSGGSIGDVIGLPASGIVSIPPSPIYKLPVSVNRSPADTILPDRYVGEIQLRAGRGDPLVKVPLEVNVRSGPMGALWMIFGGIVLGRLVKYMGEKGNDQSNLLAEYYRLEAQLAAEETDYVLVREALADLKQLVYEMKNDQARAAFTAIAARSQQLRAWRAIERQLESRRDEEAVRAIFAAIARGRTTVAAGDDAGAKTIGEEIDRLVRELGSGHVDRRPQFDIPTAQQRPAIPWYRRWLANFAGLRAEATLWFVRPLLYVLLLAGLVVVGITQLYLKNATFGSDPLSDYFALLVWGLSADVAGRTLATLKATSG